MRALHLLTAISALPSLGRAWNTNYWSLYFYVGDITVYGLSGLYDTDGCKNLNYPIAVTSIWWDHSFSSKNVALFRGRDCKQCIVNEAGECFWDDGTYNVNAVVFSYLTK